MTTLSDAITAALDELDVGCATEPNRKTKEGIRWSTEVIRRHLVQYALAAPQPVAVVPGQQVIQAVVAAVPAAAPVGPPPMRDPVDWNKILPQGRRACKAYYDELKNSKQEAAADRFAEVASSYWSTREEDPESDASVQTEG